MTNLVAVKARYMDPYLSVYGGAKVKKELSNNQIGYSALIPEISDSMWIQILEKENKHLGMSSFPVGEYTADEIIDFHSKGCGDD